ncbi:adenylosuccinate synthetase [Cordyceps javanica]|nr:adenylosuccinate synthetase [Cordyceps javanica]
MTTTIIIGSQWGDEGKGKLTDIFCSKADVVARAAVSLFNTLTRLPFGQSERAIQRRFSLVLLDRLVLTLIVKGGHNAGHVVQANGIYHNFRLLPSGLMTPKCLALIGTGVVFHIPTFLQELADLEREGIADASERVFVSDRCHVNFDLHAAVDAAQEEELGGKAIGSMKRGIGPCYSTKAIRSGIRLAEIFDKEQFEEKLRRLAAGYQKRFGSILKYDVEDEIQRFDEYRVAIQKHVVDGVLFMAQANERGANIVVEGSQAILLDIDYGTYPYVTSSSAGLGGVISGLGLASLSTLFISRKDELIPYSYTTRLGNGGFPTEDTGEVGQHLQELGGEYAAVICRKLRVSNYPSRLPVIFFQLPNLSQVLLCRDQAGSLLVFGCGWLDLVALRYSCMVNHYDSLQLSKLDVLSTFETIKVGIAYRDKETGKELPSFPADHSTLERVEVVYDELSGWNTSIAKLREWSDLPAEAQDYVKYIEQFVGVPVR